MELLRLAGDIEEEEVATIQDSKGSDDENDNTEGWIDEWLNMSKEELDELEDTIQPVRFY